MGTIVLTVATVNIKQTLFEWSKCRHLLIFESSMYVYLVCLLNLSLHVLPLLIHHFVHL